MENSWQPDNEAIAALRSLGGRSDALSLCSKLTCPHCGYGMKSKDAQLLIQRTVDRGGIVTASDFTLYLPTGPGQMLKLP